MNGSMFSRLMAEFGGTEDKQKEDDAEDADKELKEAEASTKPLMQEEDRSTGQIQWHTYGLYITASGGYVLAVTFLFLLLAEQGAQSK